MSRQIMQIAHLLFVFSEGCQAGIDAKNIRWFDDSMYNGRQLQQQVARHLSPRCLCIAVRNLAWLAAQKSPAGSFQDQTGKQKYLLRGEAVWILPMQHI